MSSFQATSTSSTTTSSTTTSSTTTSSTSNERTSNEPTPYFSTLEETQQIDHKLKPPTFSTKVSHKVTKILNNESFELRHHQENMLTPGNKVICAPSGSGKTTGVLIKVMQQLSKDSSKNGPRVIVTANTKELLSNMQELLLKYSKDVLRPRTTLMVGGKGSDYRDLKSLNAFPDVIFVSMGRLYDLTSSDGFSNRITDRMARDRRFCNNNRNAITKIDLSKVELIIMDEADSILGSTSNKTQNQLDEMYEKLTKATKHFISATFTTDAIKRACSLCDSAELYLLRDLANTLPTSLSNYFVCLGKDDRHWEFNKRMDVLLMMQELFKERKMIVFTHSGKLAEKICDKLSQMEIPFLSPWDDLGPFTSGGVRLLIAMDGISRGIDFEAVSAVINFTLPADRETYVHRVGRAARRGLNGVSLTMFAEQEFHKINSICRSYQIPLRDMNYHSDYIISLQDKNFNGMCDWVGLSSSSLIHSEDSQQDNSVETQEYPSLSKDQTTHEYPSLSKDPSKNRSAQTNNAWVSTPSVRPSHPKEKTIDPQQQIQDLMEQVQRLQAMIQ